MAHSFSSHGATVGVESLQDTTLADVVLETAIGVDDAELAAGVGATGWPPRADLDAYAAIVDVPGLRGPPMGA